ncbi:gluconokinase [Acetobacter conturbans]|uniref:Gluconokinase n=1 Tax=Acetobacter conturbans TaxID=1737472 RepID=A0ABX0K243_9PROT|nr:gluconokinase [Acetobacter conturbans]NHN89232.1 AAA family ATPase [Acetobacter conturbans]
MEHSSAADIRPRLLVVMGVSASGKSLVAEGLHHQLGWPFQEGDALHPPENIEKMAGGTPLTDKDRFPWLEKCRHWMADRAREGSGGILACSALKARYRDILRQDGLAVTFLFLKVPREELARRLQGRRQHFMPPSLLDSQLDTLEEPQSAEHVLLLEASESPAEIIAKALELLRMDQEN